MPATARKTRAGHRAGPAKLALASLGEIPARVRGRLVSVGRRADQPSALRVAEPAPQLRAQHIGLRRQHRGQIVRQPGDDLLQFSQAQLSPLQLGQQPVVEGGQVAVPQPRVSQGDPGSQPVENFLLKHGCRRLALVERLVGGLPLRFEHALPGRRHRISPAFG